MLAVLAGHPEAEPAALVASELCTNAITHTLSGSPDGVFAVTVSKDVQRAMVAVQDMGSPGEPLLADPGRGDQCESGRGLVLVAAVAKEWGTARNRLGWRVWAELSGGGQEPGW